MTKNPQSLQKKLNIERNEEVKRLERDVRDLRKLMIIIKQDVEGIKADIWNLKLKQKKE